MVEILSIKLNFVIIINQGKIIKERIIQYKIVLIFGTVNTNPPSTFYFEYLPLESLVFIYI